MRKPNTLSAEVNDGGMLEKVKNVWSKISGQQHRARHSAGRALGFQKLENRNMMSADPTLFAVAEGEGSTADNAIDVHPPYAMNVPFLDVNTDGSISPLDALIVVNHLNEKGPGLHEPFLQDQETVTRWLDTNGDGHVSPSDVLLVVNHLNTNGPGTAPEPSLTNHPPYGKDMTLTVTEGQEIYFASPFFHPGGRPITVGVGENRVDGDLTLLPNNIFRYVPGPFGQDIFTLAATVTTDEGDKIANATMTMNVTLSPGPHEPFAREDIIRVPEDTQSEIFNVLANDEDVDGDTFEIVHHTEPQHGQLVPLDDSGTFQYTPDVNYVGVDSFQYTIRDATGREDTGVVIFEINTNNAPVALNPVINVVEDHPSATITLSDLGIDADADPITVSFPTTPENGVMVPAENGHQYIPNVNFVGTDSVVYEISDGYATTLGVLDIVVSSPRFADEDFVLRGDAAFFTWNGPANRPNPVGEQRYVDVSPDSRNYSAVQGLHAANLLGSFAVGDFFAETREATIGEIAHLFAQLPTNTMNCVVRPDETNRLADHASRERFFEMAAAAEHEDACALSDAELDALARDKARQYGTTY